MPGASPAEVEQRVTRPLEKLLWEIPGVEYLYSTSSPGQADGGRPLPGRRGRRARARRASTRSSPPIADVIPPGASAPVVKPRSIDDVPVMALTLWGERYDDFSCAGWRRSCTTR